MISKVSSASSRVRPITLGTSTSTEPTGVGEGVGVLSSGKYIVGPVSGVVVAGVPVFSVLLLNMPERNPEPPLSPSLTNKFHAR